MKQKVEIVSKKIKTKKVPTKQQFKSKSARSIKKDPIKTVKTVKLYTPKTLKLDSLFLRQCYYDNVIKRSKRSRIKFVSQDPESVMISLCKKLATNKHVKGMDNKSLMKALMYLTPVDIQNIIYNYNKVANFSDVQTRNMYMKAIDAMFGPFIYEAQLVKLHLMLCLTEDDGDNELKNLTHLIVHQIFLRV